MSNDPTKPIIEPATPIPPFQQKWLKLAKKLEKLCLWDKRSEAITLIEEQLIKDGDNAEVYLGCLLKAFITGEKYLSNLANGSIETFIKGDFRVSGDYNPRKDTYYSKNIAFNIEETDRLAIWRIVEDCLIKAFSANAGDNPYDKKDAENAARHLAKSTMCLFVDPNTKALESLVSSLQKEKLNPFKDKRVLQFSGYQHSMKKEKFPFLSLFGKYVDYTPIKSHILHDQHLERVSIKTPQFLKSALEDKYDYVIAGNVFAKGVVVTTDPVTKAEKPANNAENLWGLMAVFSNVLKDGGKVVVSNITNDGVVLSLPRGEHRYGLVADVPDFPDNKNVSTHPIYNNGEWSTSDGEPWKCGVYTFTRDYSRRPDMPVTQEELDKDEAVSETNKELIKQGMKPMAGYAERVLENKDRSVLRDWGEGF